MTLLYLVATIPSRLYLPELNVIILYYSLLRFVLSPYSVAIIYVITSIRVYYTLLGCISNVYCASLYLLYDIVVKV